MKATNSESTRVKAAVYRPKIQLIQRVIGEHFGLTLHEMQKHGRKGSSIQARRYICYFSRELAANCPLSVIGLLIGNGKAFDSSTIIHTKNKLMQEMQMKTLSGKLAYPKISEKVELLRKKIIKEMIKNKLEVDIKVCPTCGHIINFGSLPWHDAPGFRQMGEP